MSELQAAADWGVSTLKQEAKKCLDQVFGGLMPPDHTGRVHQAAPEGTCRDTGKWF